MTTSFSTVNPARGENLQSFVYHSETEVEDFLQKSFLSFQSYGLTTVTEKAQLLKSLARALRTQGLSLAQLITAEMGKPLVDSQGEVERSAQAFDYYAENIQQLQADEELKAHYKNTHVRKLPLGSILAMMPWNFPLWQVTRCAAPNLALGNVILLKHSEITAGVAVKIQEIFDSVRPGLLINLRVEIPMVERLIKDPRVRGVTLTGSSLAGKSVGALAGKYLKKSVLELGGSDPYLVLEDCDILPAARTCAKAKMINNGQSCIAAKRLLVAEKIYPEFCHEFEVAVTGMLRGDPSQTETQIGSMASLKFKEKLLAQCSALGDLGAKKIFDLNSTQHHHGLGEFGFFPARAYQVQDFSQPWFQQEEIFGPVALVGKFKDEDEALRLANLSDYGLGAGIFSRDLDRALALSRNLQCGMVAINDFVRSDPRAPFGGAKNSGYGREFSRHGFEEFSLIQTLGWS